MKPVDIVININGKAVVLGILATAFGVWMKKTRYLDRIFVRR